MIVCLIGIPPGFALCAFNMKCVSVRMCIVLTTVFPLAANLLYRVFFFAVDCAACKTGQQISCVRHKE